MPPALPPWPAPDAPAAAPAPTTRAPAAPPSRAGPPPRRAPAPPPSTPRPCDWSTARRPPAAPPAGAAACRAAPASGSSLSSRCAVAGRRARPDRRRCTAPAASRPTAPRTRSSRPPRPSRDPSPAARSPGRAGPSGCPPRRGTAPPAPPRSNAPPPPPRVRLPQAKAPGYRLRHPAGTITEHISRKPYDTRIRISDACLVRVHPYGMGATTFRPSGDTRTVTAPNREDDVTTLRRCPEVNLAPAAGRRLLLALTACIPAAFASQGAAAFEPVSYKGAGATIELSRLGTFRGGIFASTSAEVPPAHDASRQRLYYLDQSRGRIDVIDINAPSRPRADGSIDLGPIGQGADAIAFRSGVLAVAFVGPTKASPGTVAFLDRDGRPQALPVTVGPQPTMLVFTPDGDKLLVPGRGEASDDYRVDPEGSISVIDWCRHFPCVRPDVRRIDFRAFDARRRELIDKGVRLRGPGASVAQDLEPESITASPDSRTAWVTLERNNAIGVVDLVSDRVTDVLPLGTKDNSRPGKGLDASDQDGRINIARWPLRSFYEPDYVAAYTSAGGTYLVTANEGDPRDFSGYTEEARVADLTLDPTAFPNRATLQRPENLGRLEVSRVDGRNARGLYERLYAFGARSLAVWTPRAKLLAETGDAFERITAAAVPELFNTPDDSNDFDATSNARGPEPEPLAVGGVGDRQYVFVGFERIGGVMAYDITDPRRPHFEQYINNRDFAVDPAAVY